MVISRANTGAPDTPAGSNSRAAPGAVVASDEGGDRGADLGSGAVDLAPNHLLLERAKEPLDHAIALRLTDEGVAQRHAPMRELPGEMAGDVLRPIVGAHRDAPRGVGACRAEAG